MISLSIPKRDANSLIKLVSLEKSEFEVITLILSRIINKFTLEHIKEAITNSGVIPAEDVDITAKVIMGLFNTKGGVNSSSEEYADMIIDACFQDGEPTADQKNNIIKLISTEGPFKYAAKASDLKLAGDKLLSASRIFTDLRPIFSDDVKCEGVKSIIINTLKLEYRNELGENQSLSLSIDAEDLSKLKDAIIRTESKNLELRRLLSNGPLEIYDV